MLRKVELELLDVDLRGARIDADLTGARISGIIDGLTVNDVEVAPLIAAELDRRHPERLRLRPTDAAGAGDAWDVVEAMWAATKVRALAVPDETLRRRVDGEWSFVETVCHLVLVTDRWIRGPILGLHDAHPMGIPPARVDPDVPPPAVAIADAVAAREDRMAAVRALVDRGVDDRALGHLQVVCDEEWHHDRFANRDLDALGVPKR